MASNIIYFNRAELAASPLLTRDEQQGGYQPKTINPQNTGRYVYLPIFPTKYFGPNIRLLLANVPVTHLLPHEITQRQFGAYTPDALMLMNNYHYANNEVFTLSEQEVDELAKRLQVGKSIITFNADQLRGICYTLIAMHESFRRTILNKRDVAVPGLNSKQMALALEFFLQIDVDIFYMKTCSFRGALPVSNTEGLFCGNDEPQAKYKMVPCGQPLCSYCRRPPNNEKKTSPSWSIIDFDSSSMHQFVNGYTTYLNCPATCQTSNVIFTMTCPCGHYDYVDSTAETLSVPLMYHRTHGNRIIHEMLTGSSLYPGMAMADPNKKEKQMANQMRLYHHSSRCPIALRLFLDDNPDYWCFIPLLWYEAQTENIAFLRDRSSSSSSSSTSSTMAATHPDILNLMTMGALSNHRVAYCLAHVPLPPAEYGFSYEQIQKQRLFFEQFLLSPIDQLPFSPIDLYKVAIIAVLPEDHSTILRYIIETLFIIHGETKLNMICPLGSDSEQRYGRPYDTVWCLNLNRPYISMAISTMP